MSSAAGSFGIIEEKGLKMFLKRLQEDQQDMLDLIQEREKARKKGLTEPALPSLKVPCLLCLKWPCPSDLRALPCLALLTPALPALTAACLPYPDLPLKPALPCPAFYLPYEPAVPAL